jgi:hypothetical protein
MKAPKCPLCGRQHFWHKPCPMGVPLTTADTKTVTKVTKVVTKMGRPLLGKTPMSGAERQRRYRARHRAQRIT